MIRLYDPIYDSKLYRNYVNHTTQAGSPLISTNHANERKQSRSSLCGVREHVRGGARSSRIIINY